MNSPAPTPKPQGEISETNTDTPTTEKTPEAKKETLPGAKKEKNVEHVQHWTLTDEDVALIEASLIYYRNHWVHMASTISGNIFTEEHRAGLRNRTNKRLIDIKEFSKKFGLSVD